MGKFKCKRCGKCCKYAPCGFAKETFGVEKGCPALVWISKGQYHCIAFDVNNEFRRHMANGKCSHPKAVIKGGKGGSIRPKRSSPNVYAII